MSPVLWIIVAAVVAAMMLCLVWAALISGSRYDDRHGFDEVP